MADVRKNQARLSRGEWQALIDAIDATQRRGAASPRYRDFVDVHIEAMSGSGMTWSVHSMGTVRGRNFLAWHRWFVRRLERRLQREDPSVTIPYWDWLADREVPRALRGRELLRRWHVTRGWDRSELPDRADLTWARRADRYGRFQSRLEFVHNDVHNAVGGDMATARSPADPLFFLHHANLDRLFAQWQANHPRTRPANAADVLKPNSLFGVPVSDVLRISALGYRYA
jgi:tyrosinase